MSKLTMEDIKVKKTEMECTIKESLRQFELDTGLTVSYISVRRLDTIGYRHGAIHDVECEVKL